MLKYPTPHSTFPGRWTTPFITDTLFPQGSSSSSSPLLDFLLLSTLSVVFVVTYVTHMYVVEVYLARPDTHFLFMALKGRRRPSANDVRKKRNLGFC